jgi:hypothetical protein
MPLVEKRVAPSPLNIRPLPTAFAVAVSVGLFVVGLTVLARLTAEHAQPANAPPPDHAWPAELPSGDDNYNDDAEIADDGVAGKSNAPKSGASPRLEASGNERSVASTPPLPSASASDDSQEMKLVDLVEVTVPLPEKVGPAFVAQPPFAPADLMSAAVVVVQACIADALRWDPSLGGPFVLHVDLAPLFSSADEPSTGPLLTTPGLLSPVLSSCLSRRAVDVSLPRLGDIEVPLAVVARATLGADGVVAWSDARITTSAVPP